MMGVNIDIIENNQINGDCLFHYKVSGFKQLSKECKEEIIEVLKGHI